MAACQLREPDFDAARLVAMRGRRDCGRRDYGLRRREASRWPEAWPLGGIPMAVVIAVQHLYRRPPEATTKFLLRLAASV